MPWRFLDVCQPSVPRASLLPASKDLHNSRLMHCSKRRFEDRDPGYVTASRADPCLRLSRTLLGPSGAEWINVCRGNGMNSKGGRTGFTLA